MGDDTSTETANNKSQTRRKSKDYKPGILVAYIPQKPIVPDRCIVSEPFTVGRSRDCSLSMEVRFLSRKHFRLFREDDLWWIEDLKSSNGTSVNGKSIKGRKKLQDSSVIRAGDAVFVFHNDARRMFSPPVERYGMVGTFHLETIIDDLQDAARSERHVLLAGETGVGKELAAAALVKMMSSENSILPFVTCNAARFISEEQAVSSLFGVAPKVFSNVDARQGLIEKADDGALFLDEAHNLTEHVQRSLLRLMENKEFSRVGNETASFNVNVRFILSSNAPPPQYGLVHDLLPRLMTVRIPSLKERTADIPTIFDQLLRYSLKKYDLDQLTTEDNLSKVDADDYERMCLVGFAEGNVREIIDIADRIAIRISNGTPFDEAVGMILDGYFATHEVSTDHPEENPERPYDIEEKQNQEKNQTTDGGGELKSQSEKKENSSTIGKRQYYEQHKNMILEVFTGEGKRKIATTCRILKEKYGIQTTRSSTEKYLILWKIILHK